MIPCFCPPFWLPGYRPHLVKRGDFALLHLFAHGAKTARHLQDVVGVQVSLLWYSDTPLAGEEVQPQSVWVFVVFISDVFPHDIMVFPNMGPEMSEWLDEWVGILENGDPVVLEKGSQNEYIQC